MQIRVKFNAPAHWTRWDANTYPKEIGQAIIYDIEVDNLNCPTYYLHNQNAKNENKEWIQLQRKMRV